MYGAEFDHKLMSCRNFEMMCLLQDFGTPIESHLKIIG